MSAPNQLVPKTFQPPSPIGFFEALRMVRLPQSLAAISTVNPSFRKRSAATRACECGTGVSTASSTTIFSPLYPASAISFLALSKSRLPVSASDPALFAIGVPQVKNDGQRFQLVGSPARALINSA